MKAHSLLDNYMHKPYRLVFIYDAESHTYTAMVDEFPGCISQGGSIQEAHSNLMEAADLWISAVLDTGQKVPEPTTDYSQEEG